MPKLIILRGVPGCGKSTWTKEQIQTNLDLFPVKVVNKDLLRLMLDGGEWSKEKERFVLDVQHNIIRSALEQDINVVADNTHLVQKTVNKLHSLAREVGDVTVEEVFFDVPLETCLERNAAREGLARVPDKVVRDMYKQSQGIKNGGHIKPLTYFPKPTPVQQDKSLPAAIICDLDGSLCLLNGRDPYNASTCEQDLPNVPVAIAVYSFWLAGLKILFVSGREDKYKDPTIKFLEKTFPKVEVDGDDCMLDYELYMRKSGDYRKDYIIKEEILRRDILSKYCVDIVIDDRPSVIRMWRGLGLTCFALNDKEF